MIRIQLEDGTVLNLAKELGEETWRKVKQVEILAGVESELLTARGSQKLPVAVSVAVEGEEPSGEESVALVDVPVRAIVLMDPQIGVPVMFGMPTAVAEQIGRALADDDKPKIETFSRIEL